MPLHSYTRCWLHIVWATIERRPLLPKPAAAKLSAHLHDYAKEKCIYMKINFVNADHTHISNSHYGTRPARRVRAPGLQVGGFVADVGRVPSPGALRNCHNENCFTQPHGI